MELVFLVLNFFFFSSRRRHTRCSGVSWARDVYKRQSVGYAIPSIREARASAVQDRPPHRHACLLYTSDAADEEDSVDLGGRRIIKKKKNRKDGRHAGSST